MQAGDDLTKKYNQFPHLWLGGHIFRFYHVIIIKAVSFLENDPAGVIK